MCCLYIGRFPGQGNLQRKQNSNGIQHLATSRRTASPRKGRYHIKSKILETIKAFRYHKMKIQEFVMCILPIQFLRCVHLWKTHFCCFHLKIILFMYCTSSLKLAKLTVVCRLRSCRGTASTSLRCTVPLAYGCLAARYPAEFLLGHASKMTCVH